MTTADAAPQSDKANLASRLEEMGRSFSGEPLSKSISEIEVAGELMREAVGALAKGYSGAVPKGWKLVPDYQGYAHLGIGDCVVSTTNSQDPAEIIIRIATDADKAGRVVGDKFDIPYGSLYRPEEICVRLRFATAFSLDVLEAHLRELRDKHFSAAPIAQAAVQTADQYIATLPADWHKDSSLETWFPLTHQELESTKRMFMDACSSLGLIDEALGISPDESGGAAPILDAIEELKSRLGAAPLGSAVMFTIEAAARACEREASKPSLLHDADSWRDGCNWCAAEIRSMSATALATTESDWKAVPVERDALASSIAEVQALSDSEDRDITVSEAESMMLVLLELNRLQAVETDSAMHALTDLDSPAAPNGVPQPVAHFVETSPGVWEQVAPEYNGDIDAVPLYRDAVAVPVAIPSDVVAAVERMCSPLHESRLSGVTAEADARCMALIRRYVLGDAASTPICAICNGSGWYVVEGPTSEADGHHPNLEQCDCAAPAAPALPVDASPALLNALHRSMSHGGQGNLAEVHPVAVHRQHAEHQLSEFEEYQFSDGTAKVMTRTEFDREHGQSLRIQLEQARQNRDLNAAREANKPAPAVSIEAALVAITQWTEADRARLSEAMKDIFPVAAVPAEQGDETRKLAVLYEAMPESNGKTNWTAILHAGDIAEGITLDRSEYPDRVRYEADRARYLIGEIDKAPFILDYDSEKHSGYVAAPVPHSGEAATTAAADEHLIVPVPADMVEARAQGRAEAVAMLLDVDPDTFCAAYIVDGGSLPSGERSEGWDDGKLREFFRADDCAWSLLQAAQGEYWHNLGLREEAERNHARSKDSTPSQADLDARTVLEVKAGLWDEVRSICVPHGAGVGKPVTEWLADRLAAQPQAAPSDELDTLVAVLDAIGYTEEFAKAHPDLKVSEGVKAFLASQAAPVAAKPFTWCQGCLSAHACAMRGECSVPPSKLNPKVAADIELMRKAFRTTESCGPDNHYAMIFKFKSLTELHAADDEWREFATAKSTETKA